MYKMGVDELYLDLLALRELYILLLKSCLRDANSQLVDERAQVLLKHLLDDATAGFLPFHPKNLATDSGIFKNFPHTDEKQTKPWDEKVAEWMEHNYQSARKMGNPEIEKNPRRAKASASNVASNDLSNGIGLALRRIELHILSLQRCISQSRNTRSHINGAKVANSRQSRTDHSNLKARFTEPIKGHNLSSQFRTHLLGGQKVKPMVTDHCFEFVHGFRIPLRQDNDATMKPSTVETQILEQHKLINPMIPIDKSGCSMGSKASIRSSRKLNPTRIHERRCQNSYRHMIMRSTLLDHPSKGIRKEKIHKKTHLATQQESESSNSESESASSSWATQQASRSETTDYPSSPTHQEDPPASDSEASSRYRSSSSISTKAFRFSHGKKGSKKAIGRFKRLKNKLGLIFHHHHHHHHHHHKYNNNNFMWKQLRKIFHCTGDKRLTTKEERYGKLKKSAIRSVSRNNQVGKFQALAEGLRSHVWKSKAMKKKELGGLNCGKKDLKKLHWWKMFRRHRGVKLPNKGRVKIGYGNRKPQLKII